MSIAPSRAPDDAVAEIDAARRPKSAASAWMLGARAATLLTNLTLLLCGICTSIVVSRALGPGERGEYVTWQAWAAAIAIFALGGVPQVIVMDDRKPRRHTLRELLAPLSWTFGAAAIILIALSMAKRPSGMVLVASLLIVLTNQLASVAAGEAQRMGRMGAEFNVARLVPQVAALAAMVVLLLSGAAAASTWLLSIAGLQAFAAIVWMMSVMERGPSTPGLRRTLRDSLRLAPANWLTLLQYRFDVLAVAAFYPPKIVAYYATGLAAQGAILAAGQSNGMLWFARHRQSTIDRSARLRSELRRTAAVAAALAIPTAVTSSLWVPGVYGAAFAPAVPIVLGLCAVGVVQSMDYLLAHECLVIGGSGQIMRCRLPSILILVVGFGLAFTQSWPTAVLAVLPGLGYALSAALFLVAVRARRAPVPDHDGPAREREIAERVAGH